LLQEAVEKYLAKNRRFDHRNPKHTIDLCAVYSEALERFLLGEGIQAKLLRVDGFKGDLPPDAHPNWLKRPKDRYWSIWHCAVLVGDTVVDVTASQFGSARGERVLIPLDEYRQEWSNGAILGPEGTLPKRFWEESRQN
jgi:hypothetical protein